MDRAILREAPRSEEVDRFPRLADNAAPAAICCFLDFAGMYGTNPHNTICRNRGFYPGHAFASPCP
jgi:hypothetical protein